MARDRLEYGGGDGEARDYCVLYAQFCAAAGELGAELEGGCPAGVEREG